MFAGLASTSICLSSPERGQKIAGWKCQFRDTIARSPLLVLLKRKERGTFKVVKVAEGKRRERERRDGVDLVG